VEAMATTRVMVVAVAAGMMAEVGKHHWEMAQLVPMTDWSVFVV